jgi:hypothetical protein
VINHESPVNVILEAQKAPDIHFTAPDVTVNVAAPDVTVTPEVKVNLGTRQTITEIERDADGLITKTQQIETDVPDSSSEGMPQ